MGLNPLWISVYLGIQVLILVFSTRPNIRKPQKYEVYVDIFWRFYRKAFVFLLKFIYPEWNQCYRAMWDTCHHIVGRPQGTEGGSFHAWIVIDGKFSCHSRLVYWGGNSYLALDEWETLVKEISIWRISHSMGWRRILCFRIEAVGWLL
jgi:hypothetical protein